MSALKIISRFIFILAETFSPPDSYNITNARGRVAKFLLFKQAYKLGEDIVGMFDFSVGTVTCVQVRFFPHQKTSVLLYFNKIIVIVKSFKNFISIKSGRKFKCFYKLVI